MEKLINILNRNLITLGTRQGRRCSKKDGSRMAIKGSGIWDCHFGKTKHLSGRSRLGVPIVALQATNLTSFNEVEPSIAASLSELRIQHCHKLCCRSQMWLGSVIDVAEV